MKYKLYGNKVGDAAVDFSTKADNFMVGVNSLDLAARDMGLDISRTATLMQTHSAEVIYTDEFEFRRAADAVVTDKANLVLCIRTADCAPVLLYDAVHNVIGAAHAGRRGTRDGIIENTVALMMELGSRAGDIHAYVGPMLQKKSHILSTKDRDEFIERSAEFEKYFANVGGAEGGGGAGDKKVLFDFGRFVQDRLMAAGIRGDAINISTVDTYSSADWHSYRRNINLEGGNGRACNVAMICMGG